MTHAPVAPARRASRAVVLTTLAGVISLTPVAGASASGWPSPAIRPADAAASFLTPQMPAGGRWTSAVEIINTAPIARRVRVYAVDATVLRGGAFAPTTRARRHVGRWLTPAARGVLLAPWERRRIGVRAAVPTKAAARLYLGAVIVEEHQPPIGTAQFRVVARAGVRVYLKVTTRRGSPAGRASARPQAVSR